MARAVAVPCPLLQDVVSSAQSHHPRGDRVPLTRGIKPALADALYGMVLREQPEVVIEIGMCHGISSLAILAGLDKAARDSGGRRDGRLISIDPRQGEEYAYIGVEHVRRAGFASRHTLMEEPDWRALPRLVEQGLSAGLVYIDGNHAVDYVMLDAFYGDRLVPVGGVLAFNDCAMRSVTLVVRWLQSHRAYQELDAGLKADYGKDPLTWISHRLQGRNASDRYFRKTGTTQRGYDGHLRW